MASTPTVPTSFLPHPSVASVRNSAGGIADVIAYLAFVVSGAIFALAVGVFLYGQVLDKTKLSKDAQLSEASKNLDTKVVTGFVRLHDRLAAATMLLSKHVGLSKVFPVIEAIVPSTVRFTSLHLAFDDKGNLKLDAAGVAKNFNSLAVASAAFASDARINGAIFSGIGINNKDGSVNFTLSATLDSKLAAFTL